MKLSRSLLVVAGVCVFVQSSHAGTNHWDPHVGLDAMAINPPYTPSTDSPAPQQHHSSSARPYASIYQRVVLQPEAPPETVVGVTGLRLTAPQLLFILSTDLEIPGGGPATQASTLANALASDKGFRRTILPFLDKWRQPKDKKTSLEGLATVNKVISGGFLPTTTVWRFGVSPIPAGAQSQKLAKPPVFEIRLIINVDALGFDPPQRTELARQLATLGSNSSDFLAAMKTLRDRVAKPPYSAVYPLAAELIEVVFHPPK